MIRNMNLVLRLEWKIFLAIYHLISMNNNMSFLGPEVGFSRFLSFFFLSLQVSSTLLLEVM